jgi:hypothetical protein
MTELEKLEAERDKISMQIKILELENKPVFDYSNYENKYFEYNEFDDKGFVFIKKWKGSKYSNEYTTFDIVTLSEKSIEFKEDYGFFILKLFEITKEEYEKELNKILTLLK